MANKLKKVFSDREIKITRQTSIEMTAEVPQEPVPGPLLWIELVIMLKSDYTRDFECQTNELLLRINTSMYRKNMLEHSEKSATTDR